MKGNEDRRGKIKDESREQEENRRKKGKEKWKEEEKERKMIKENIISARN